MLCPQPVPRKGARRRAEIPPDILAQINRGEEETITLVEGLAADARSILTHQFPDIPQTAIETIDPKAGYIERGRQAARILLNHHGIGAVKYLAAHRSDLVRGWAAGMIGLYPRWSFIQKLQAVRPLADDSNPHVREWAWLFLRPAMLEGPLQAIDALIPWTTDPSPNLRRYASEMTRPRGVWCAHCTLLKEQPEKGLPILTPLRVDPSRYVQDSVGNWLNDASKTRPDFVKQTVQKWQQKKRTMPPETARIIRRALRSFPDEHL